MMEAPSPASQPDTPPRAYHILFIVYMVLVPGIGCVGLPWLLAENPTTRPIHQLILWACLCAAAVASLAYVTFAQWLRPPRKPWILLVIVFDAPLFAALTMLLDGEPSIGGFAWDALIELSGLSLWVLFGTLRHMWRWLVRAGLRGLFLRAGKLLFVTAILLGPMSIGTLMLTALQITSVTQALVVAPAVVVAAATFDRMWRRPWRYQKHDADPLPEGDDRKKLGPRSKLIGLGLLAIPVGLSIGTILRHGW